MNINNCPAVNVNNGICQIKDCPAPYCKFSNEENADKIFDLIDEYVELKEVVSNKEVI